MPDGAAPKERKRLPDGLAPRLLGAEAAAAYCGVSGATFLDLVAPQVRSLKIGARRLYDVRSIDAWVDARAGGGEAAPARSWVERVGDADPNEGR